MSLLPFDPSRDTGSLGEVHAVAFGVDAESAAAWWARGGHDNLRVWREGGRLLGTLLTVPQGLFLGGRSVPTHGVAGVAVAAEARGRGTARAMMRAYLEELHANGVPLSMLYASTQGLYRSVGYELAGQHHTIHLSLDPLRQVGRRDGDWLPLTDLDRAEVCALYQRLARHRHGYVDRGPYLWQRIWANRGVPNTGFVLRHGGTVAGWIVLRQEHNTDSGFLTVHLVDHGAVDALALRQVAGLLSTFGAMARSLHLRAGPTTPLLDLLPELRHTQRLFEPPLVRIVRLADALNARGWPVGLRGTVDLEVTDPVLADNEGRWRLAVQDGEAMVTRGGGGAARIDIASLASLYTGYATPFELQQRGLLTATDQALPTLTALFCSPMPGSPDMF
jgi:predicted acetyltransferase